MADAVGPLLAVLSPGVVLNDDAKLAYVEKAAAVVDTNNDGSLDLSEFLSWFMYVIAGPGILPPLPMLRKVLNLNSRNWEKFTEKMEGRADAEVKRADFVDMMFHILTEEPGNSSRSVSEPEWEESCRKHIGGLHQLAVSIIGDLPSPVHALAVSALVCPFSDADDAYDHVMHLIEYLSDAHVRVSCPF